MVGDHHPTDPPARHREVLREAVDDNGIGRVSEHRRGDSVVDDAVIDLVSNDRNVVVAAVSGDFGECIGRQHRSGRVRRGGEHEPVEMTCCAQMVGSWGPPAVGPNWDWHCLDTEGDEGVPVAGIARLNDTDPLAGLKQREEGQ